MQIFCAISHVALAFVAASSTLNAARLNGADAVVIGEITGGQHSGSLAVFRLRVERVLHGAMIPGTVLDVRAASRAYSPTDKLSGIRGMWMLQAGANDRWTTMLPLQSSGGGFISSFYPLAPTTDVEAFKRALPGLKDPGDFVAAEMAAALENMSDIRPGFEVLSLGLRFHVPHTPGTLTIFRRLFASSAGAVASVGLAGMLLQNDPDALDRLESALPMVTKAGMLGEVSSALGMRVDPSPRNVAGLGRLATSPAMVARIRHEAATALERIHSRDALPHFVRLMDSPDVKLREIAFAGLSMFVDNLGIITQESLPSMAWLKPVGPARFRTAETDKFVGYRGAVPAGAHTAHVAFWKAWWARYGSEITARP